MLFNSYQFIFLFFPICYLVAHQLKGKKIIAWISFTSIVFYSYAGDKWFLIPMLFTTTLDYFLGRVIENSSRPKAKFILILSLVLNLGLLFYFKYSAFFSDNVLSVLELFGWSFGITRALSDVILPAGISFYTFQTISYIVDVYNRKCHAETDYLKFVAFVSFFPHIVAGPLTRHNQLIPQLDRISETGIKNNTKIAGITLFIIGLTKKLCIADPIAGEINTILLEPGTMTVISAWMASLGYMLQIYFDFSGYSEMAIGLGRFFNIELPQNFNRPYKALNPSDFWKRWHISLSLWLRDYLYIPLGGNRCSEGRKDINLLITMVLGGLWHGANLTFLVWGTIHGLALILFKKFAEKSNIIFQRTMLFFVVLMGWIFFRAPTLRIALGWLKKHFYSPNPVGNLNYLCLGLIALGFILVIIEPDFTSKTRALNHLTMKWKIALGCLLGLCISLIGKTSVFLYFQF